jgi:hypothetical protein
VGIAASAAVVVLEHPIATAGRELHQVLRALDLERAHGHGRHEGGERRLLVLSAHELRELHGGVEGWETIVLLLAAVLLHKVGVVHDMLLAHRRLHFTRVGI